MPLQLPNLDARTYADLVDEARSLIVTYDPEWTNHNPSDPGITLLELFAYLTEILLYRMNRVTEANQRKFIKLLAPESTPSADVLADIRDAVLGIRTPFRAVTAADYERLVLEDFNRQASAVPVVARARCVPRRNLTTNGSQPAPGHVSVVLVVEGADVPQPPQPLIDAVFAFLDERRTLTTRLHVVGPTRSPIGVELIVARSADAFEEDIRGRVAERLRAFLHPLTGGADGRGWPFGRDVFISELLAQLETVPGVDFVPDLVVTSRCDDADARCVPGQLSFHSEGDPIGVQLDEDRLPLARIDPATIWVAPSASFVSATVSVKLTTSTAQNRQIAKQIVREFFHPLHGGHNPDPTANTDFALSALNTALLSASGQVTALGVDAPHRLPPGASPTGTQGLRLLAGEVVNLRVQFV